MYSMGKRVLKIYPISSAPISSSTGIISNLISLIHKPCEKLRRHPMSTVTCLSGSPVTVIISSIWMNTIRKKSSPAPNRDPFETSSKVFPIGNDITNNSVRVVMLLSQCSGGDSLRITLIIALALTLCTHLRLPID